ncbi:conserved hypothetical protein [Candidatus Zixiibacteriota bacterium]|nr:conserved hypothetical protein [candidate division Zixibacteria bacterium]
MSVPGNQELNSLIDKVLEESWRFSPSQATLAGIHKYDREMDHVDGASRKTFLSLQKEWLAKLDEIEAGNDLDFESKLDLKVLKAELKKNILSEEMLCRAEREPSQYPGTAVFSCMIFTMRDFLSPEERYLSMIARLKEIPRYLIEAKENLRRAEFIPRLWLQMACDITSAGQSFFTQLITHNANHIPLLRNDLLAAATLASKGFDDYLKFLNNELSKKPDGSWATGEKYIEALLKDYHLLPYDSGQLEEIGLDYIRLTETALEKVAREISPGKKWAELIDEIKSDTPSAGKLLEYYREEILRSRDFVMTRDLVTIPDNENLEVIETPVTERAALPYAAYMPPAPFEEPQKGFFWVTPVNPRELNAKEQLSGHSKCAIEVRTLHEGYPGHHLQLCVANRLKSRVRRLYGTAVFVEGWALYCEELMKREGFYTGKGTELIQLKDQLWRACRVVIDMRLHSGRFGFEEAVDMLVKTARLERISAEAEVRRYSQTPTQPMSYLIGKIEIQRLAEDFRKRYPDESLRSFHDRLLSFGSVPISLARQGLMGTM